MGDETCSFDDLTLFYYQSMLVFIFTFTSYRFNFLVCAVSTSVILLIHANQEPFTDLVHSLRFILLLIFLVLTVLTLVVVGMVYTCILTYFGRAIGAKSDYQGVLENVRQGVLVVDPNDKRYKAYSNVRARRIFKQMGHDFFINKPLTNHR